MEQFNKKIRLIFIPFLLISIGTIVIYTFLHWLLCIKNHIINIDSEALNYVIPVLLPGIPILIWLRPRIKLLDVTAYIKSARGGDPFTNYIMFAWLAVIFPLILIQLYLDTKSGQLTELNYISEIKTAPATKYYKVRNFYIDKNLFRVRRTYNITGKHDQIYDMIFYIPCPFFDYNDTSKTEIAPDTTAKGQIVVLNGRRVAKIQTSGINSNSVKSMNFLKSAEATAIYGAVAAKGAIVIQTYDSVDFNSPALRPDANQKHSPAAWLTVQFEKDTSNNLSKNELAQAYDKFAIQSLNKLADKRLDNFIYLERLGSGSTLKSYLKTINAPSYPVLKQPVIILSPIFKPYESRNGNKLPWAIASFFIGSLFFLMLLSLRPFAEHDNKTPPKKARSNAS